MGTRESNQGKMNAQRKCLCLRVRAEAPDGPPTAVSKLTQTTTNNPKTSMRVTNPKIPLTILGLAVSFGLVLAIHTGQARSGAPATISSKPATDAPSLRVGRTRPVASSQWHWQNPLPQGNNLRGASFVDANT